MCVAVSVATVFRRKIYCKGRLYEMSEVWGMFSGSLATCSAWKRLWTCGPYWNAEFFVNSEFHTLLAVLKTHASLYVTNSTVHISVCFLHNICSLIHNHLSYYLQKKGANCNLFYIISVFSTELHEHTFQTLLSFFCTCSIVYGKLIVHKVACIHRALSLYYKLINRCNQCVACHVCWNGSTGYLLEKIISFPKCVTVQYLYILKTVLLWSILCSYVLYYMNI